MSALQSLQAVYSEGRHQFAMTPFTKIFLRNLYRTLFLCIKVSYLTFPDKVHKPHINEAVLCPHSTNNLIVYLKCDSHYNKISLGL